MRRAYSRWLTNSVEGRCSFFPLRLTDFFLDTAAPARRDGGGDGIGIIHDLLVSVRVAAHRRAVNSGRIKAVDNAPEMVPLRHRPCGLAPGRRGSPPTQVFTVHCSPCFRGWRYRTDALMPPAYNNRQEGPKRCSWIYINDDFIFYCKRKSLLLIIILSRFLI